MICICPTRKLIVESRGNTLRHAHCFADYDGDCLNELIVGTIDGTLSIFKDRMRSPWKHAEGLGTISAMTFGSVGSQKNINYLFVVNSEGWIYLFRHRTQKITSGNARRLRMKSADQLEHDIPSNSMSPNKTEECQAIENVSPQSAKNKDIRLISPESQQLLLPNARMIMLLDTNNSGENVLVIAYADRRVRAFTYVIAEGSISRSKGKFSVSGHWTLDGQIGTITPHIGESNRMELIASQPSGTFMSLSLAPQSNNFENSLSDVFYNPPSSVSARIGNNAFTEVIGSLSGGPNTMADNLAVGTSDGFIALMNRDKIKWSAQIDATVIGIDKIDINDNGVDEVVICCHDGRVFIVDVDRNFYKLNFNFRASNFFTGKYGIDGSNAISLALLTHQNRIIIYNGLEKAVPPISIEPVQSYISPQEHSELFEFVRKEKKYTSIDQVTKNDLVNSVRMLAKLTVVNHHHHHATTPTNKQ